MNNKNFMKYLLAIHCVLLLAGIGNVFAAATITIIKDSQPNTPAAFNFSANGQVGQNFSLTDNGVIGPDRITFSNLTLFGPANTVTVTETSLGSFYSLTAITCHSDVINNSIINVPNRLVTIELEDFENVTCIFVNAVTTAASVSVTGSIRDDFGQAIPRTLVTILNTNTGETQRVASNSFGNYHFDNLVVGDFYIITVANKKYVFSPDTQSFVLNDAIENLNFTATSQ